MSALPDVAAIAEQLACCSPDLDRSDQAAQLALLRLLADGEPVEPGRLARTTGLKRADVIERLARWPDVQIDQRGLIVAFHGLSVIEAPHRLRIDGRTLYTWCAWDTLFLPELIGREAEVESACPVTSETVSLRVTREGPRDVKPPEAVISFVLPTDAFGSDTIASFCAFIHFFASREAAESWTRERPGTFVISIADGYEIGRRRNAAQWGAALGGGPDG